MEEHAGMTQEVAERIRREVEKVIIGQRELCDLLMVCLFAGGHALIEGVPGLGKTLAARTLARTVDASFGRIQFTPDIMPADITGTNVYDFSTRTFHLKKGPVFTQFLLADEINRTPPKTQSALLEVMEERRVTIDGTNHALDEPFMVFATQNPIEYEGTYPLPEAQLDRFMMKLLVIYPGIEAEEALLRNYIGGFDAADLNTAGVEVVATPESVMACRREVSQTYVDSAVLRYLAEVVESTRKTRNLVLGASPRASVVLLKASRALALMEGRNFVIPEDIQYLAPHVLRHRVVLSPDAELTGVTADMVIAQALSGVRVPIRM